MANATERLQLKLTPDDKKRWQELAQRQGLSLSALIKQHMNRLTNPDKHCPIPEMPVKP